MHKQYIYITLIITGFAVFLAVPFISYHRLSSEHIRQTIEDPDRQKLLTEELTGLIDKPIGSWQLAGELGAAMTRVNLRVAQSNGLHDDEIEALAGIMTTSGLSKTYLDSLLDKDKAALVDSYGNWLYGKVYDNVDEARQQLEALNHNLIQYEILPKQGFDRYRQKAIKYSLARASLQGPASSNPLLWDLLSFGLVILGALGLSLQMLQEPPGIKNNGIFRHPATSRKWLGIIIGTFLITFYIILYFYPELMTAWISLADPLSKALSGNQAGPFFLYGFLYTLSVLVMGVRMLIKYRFNRYQVVRTLSVMFFQTAFAFIIPEILVRLNQPYFDFKNIWPLDYDFFFDFEINKLLASGRLGIFMLGWGIMLSFIGVPLFTYFYGKRWYCSWVCGCGGLAETLGDPFRQLSDKSTRAWKIEQGLIYSVLAFAVVMTIGVLYTYFTGQAMWLGINTYTLREIYGALIGAVFAGVVGTGFYPLMGNRIWCRFGCPLAAYMGIIQRFKSRFRITTNGGQCISCGNCSTYCEMGIDVRAYAQKGENIVRASCVGCGICAAVCPRGVLKLENADPHNRSQPNGFIK